MIREQFNDKPEGDRVSPLKDLRINKLLNGHALSSVFQERFGAGSGNLLLGKS